MNTPEFTAESSLYKSNAHYGSKCDVGWALARGRDTDTTRRPADRLLLDERVLRRPERHGTSTYLL